MTLNLIRLFSLIASLALVPLANAEPISERHQACVDKLISTELARTDVRGVYLNVITPKNAKYKYDLSNCWIEDCHKVEFFAEGKGAYFSGYAEVKFENNSCRFHSHIPVGQASALGGQQTNMNLAIMDRSGQKVIKLTNGPHNEMLIGM